MQRIDHCSPAKKLLAGDAMLQFFVKNYVIWPGLQGKEQAGTDRNR
jgi:hypothetical protein